jgi:hypothetical protein
MAFIITYNLSSNIFRVVIGDKAHSPEKEDDIFCESAFVEDPLLTWKLHEGKKLLFLTDFEDTIGCRGKHIHQL